MGLLPRHRRSTCQDRGETRPFWTVDFEEEAHTGCAGMDFYAEDEESARAWVMASFPHIEIASMIKTEPVKGTRRRGRRRGLKR